MIEQALQRLQPGRRPGVAAGLRAGVSRITALLQQICQRRRQRLALARLDARLLDDIGVSAEAARREASKPPWRA